MKEARLVPDGAWKPCTLYKVSSFGFLGIFKGDPIQQWGSICHPYIPSHALLGLAFASTQPILQRYRVGRLAVWERSPAAVLACSGSIHH